MKKDCSKSKPHRRAVKKESKLDVRSQLHLYWYIEQTQRITEVVFVLMASRNKHCNKRLQHAESQTHNDKTVKYPIPMRSGS